MQIAPTDTLRPSAGAISLTGGSRKGLLDTLTAARWDLKYLLLDRADCPAQMNTSVQRVVDDLNAAIDKLRSLSFDPDLLSPAARGRRR